MNVLFVGGNQDWQDAIVAGLGDGEDVSRVNTMAQAEAVFGFIDTDTDQDERRAILTEMHEGNELGKYVILVDESCGGIMEQTNDLDDHLLTGIESLAFYGFMDRPADWDASQI